MEHESMVDIMMPVYNQERFIAQTIESIINQKTTFRYRLLIGEDCSKDNSRSMVKKYADLYPEKIFPIYNEVNLGSNGNSSNIYLSVTAKYIALCEGDDFWVDDRKLQKQVDFMERNPDFSACFSNVEIVDELNTNLPIFPPFTKDVYEIQDFINSEMNIVPTPSLLFRNVLPRPLPHFYNIALGGDMITQLLLADKGKLKFMNEKLAAYRNHSGGMSKSKENLEKSEMALKKAYMELNAYFDFRYDKFFRQRFLAMAKKNLIYVSKGKKGVEKLRHYFRAMPEYLKYSDKINFKELGYYHVVLFLPFLLKQRKASQ